MMSSALEVQPKARRLRPPARSARGAATRRIFAAGLALFAAQVACNDGGSPTAPPMPVAEPLRPAVIDASFTILIERVNEGGIDYPMSGEVLIDGRSLWGGSIGLPPSYYNAGLRNVQGHVADPLEQGQHTLSFRLTQQRRSPTAYSLSGWVDVRWAFYRGQTEVGQRRSQRVASWQDSIVRLRTGQTWTIPFTVPDGPD